MDGAHPATTGQAAVLLLHAALLEKAPQCLSYTELLLQHCRALLTESCFSKTWKQRNDSGGFHHHAML